MMRKPKGVTARLRARKRARQLRADKTVYQQVDERDGGVSRLSKQRGIIHKHHIVYRSRGGRTTLENVLNVTDDEHRMIHAGLLKLSGNANIPGGVEVRNMDDDLLLTC